MKDDCIPAAREQVLSRLLSISLRIPALSFSLLSCSLSACLSMAAIALVSAFQPSSNQTGLFDNTRIDISLHFLLQLLRMLF